MSRLATLLVVATVGCSPNGAASPALDSTSSTTGFASTVERPATQDGQDVHADDDETTDADFLDPYPELGGVSIECDVWAQDCPAGQKCMPWANDGGTSWNATKCVPIDPDPAAPGEPCLAVENGLSGLDDCDLASMCWSVDPVTLEGVCLPLCVGSEVEPHCEDPQSECIVSASGVLNLCHPTCDPVLQDCELEGLPDDACVPVHDAFACIFVAAPGAGYGTPCASTNDCEVGLFCANAAAVPGCSSSQGCCSEFCDATDPDASASCAGASQGQVCIPWFDEDEAPPFLAHVGACALPM